MKYAFSTGYTVSVAAAVAILLDCPLLGSDSDYYVICCNSEFASNDISSKLQFIPMSGVSLTPMKRVPRDALSSSESPYFLRAHMYNAAESLLSHLQPVSCRIFGILSGDSATPRLRLPDEVMEVEIPDKMRHHSSASACSAIKLAQWIGKVGPSDAVQSVVDLIEDCDLQQHISECIIQSITRTQLDVKEAFQLLLELECAATSNDFVTATLSNYMNSNNDRKGAAVLTCSVRLSESIVKHWPPRMLKAYRRGLVCSFLLSSLFCEGGSFFPCSLDYIATLPSSFSKALCIRYITYGLMYSFEAFLENDANLEGVKPHLIEIHPTHSGNVQLLSLSIEKNTLPQCAQLNVGFIYSKFGYTPDSRLPAWLNSFALCLLIWFQQKASEDDCLKGTRTGDCPIVLAAAVCAIAQSFNANVPWEDVNEKYSSVASVAEREANESTRNNASIRQPYGNRSQFIIHGLAEIQNIYSELSALDKFMQALCYTFSSSDNFPPSPAQVLPSHCIFPSNELFFWLTKCFEAAPLQQRSHAVMRVWFPRLLCQSVSGNLSERLVAVVSDLNCLLQHLNSAFIRLPDIPKTSADLPLSSIRKDNRKLFSPQKTLESLLKPLARPVKPEKPKAVQWVEAPPTGSEPAFPESSQVPPLMLPPKTCPEFGVVKGTPANQKRSKGFKSEWSRKPPVAMAGGDVTFGLPRDPKPAPKWGRKPGGYAALLKQRVGLK